MHTAPGIPNKFSLRASLPSHLDLSHHRRLVTQQYKELLLISDVVDYFQSLQQRICAEFERVDRLADFSLRLVAPNGGMSRPRVLADGRHIEKAAVQFTHSIGAALPPAATERNPHLAGLPFQATAISLIVHPQNPHVPITHMNLRFFFVEAEEPFWYFGGGYDLTPCYPVKEDAIDWHRTARDAVGEHIRRSKKLATTTSLLLTATKPEALAVFSSTTGATVVLKRVSTSRKPWAILFYLLTCLSSNGARNKHLPKPCETSNSIAGDAMRNSIWPLIAVPNMACKVAVGSNPSWHRCRPW